MSTMNLRQATFVLLAGAFILTAHVTGFGQNPKPSPAPVSVTVVNTPSQPVPVTGTVNVGNLGSSPLPVTGTVNIGNAVQFQPAIPPGYFSAIHSLADVSGIFKIVLSGPDAQGLRYAITSVTVTNDSSSSSEVQLQTYLAPSFLNVPCNSGALASDANFRVWVEPHATVHVAFPQPLVMDTNPSFPSCLEASMISGALDGSIAVVGYRF